MLQKRVKLEYATDFVLKKTKNAQLLFQEVRTVTFARDYRSLFQESTVVTWVRDRS